MINVINKKQQDEYSFGKGTDTTTDNLKSSISDDILQKGLEFVEYMKKPGNDKDFFEVCHKAAEVFEMDYTEFTLKLLKIFSAIEPKIIKCEGMKMLKDSVLKQSYPEIEKELFYVIGDYLKTLSIEREKKVAESLKFMIVTICNKNIRKKATSAYLTYKDDFIKKIKKNDLGSMGFLDLAEKENVVVGELLYILWLMKRYQKFASLFVAIQLDDIEENEEDVEDEISEERLEFYKLHSQEKHCYGNEDIFIDFLENYLQLKGKSSSYILASLTDEDYDEYLKILIRAYDKFYEDEHPISKSELERYKILVNVLKQLILDETTLRKIIENIENGKIEEQINTILDEKKALNNEIAENLNIIKNLNKEKDKILKDFDNKIQKKEKEIQALYYDEIADLKKKLEEYENQIKENEKERNELHHLREFAYNMSLQDKHHISDSLSIKDFADKNILMFGGHIKMLQRIREKHENIDTLEIRDITSFNDSIIKKYDLVCVNTNFLNHSAYYKLMNACDKYDVDFIYIGNENIEKIEGEIAGYFAKRGSNA